MFFILSKLLDFLIAPIVWCIVLLLASVISKIPLRKKKYFIAGLVVLIFFTNPFIVNSIMNQWEIQDYNIDKIKGVYDVGIVMGGASRYYNEETQRLVYGGGVDRVIEAVELYNRKKIKKILLTGGSGYVFTPQFKEAVLLKKVLINLSIPDSDLIIENESRNTYENAKFTADRLKSRQFGNRYIIITSAFHMRRTMACFNKQGIIADQFPVDEHSVVQSFTPDNLIVPDVNALATWDMLIHEWIGILLYRLSGFI